MKTRTTTLYGDLELPINVSDSEFLNQFIEFLESKGYQFFGTCNEGINLTLNSNSDDRGNYERSTQSI